MPLSPDAKRYLHGAINGLLLTTDIGIGTRLGDISIDPTIDYATPAFITAVSNEVLNWWTTATPFQCALMAHSGLCSSAEPMTLLRHGVSGILAESFICQRRGLDNLWGFPKDDPRNAQFPLLDMTIPSIQFLRKPEAVLAVLDKQKLFRDFLPQLRYQYDRFVEAVHGIDFIDFIVKLIVNAHKNYGEQQNDPEPLLPSEYRVQPLPSDLRSVHKALKRGVRAMGELIAPDAYKAFVSPDGLLIKGHAFNYRAKKNVGLLLHTAYPQDHHVPYELTLWNKRDDVALARGCITFEQTPVLDQVIALSLHVRDRECEIALLSTGNWTLTEAGETHDRLQNIINPFPVLSHLPANIWQFASRRRKIMRGIQKDVDLALAEISGVPYSFFKFLAKPSQDFLIDRAEGTLEIDPPLIDCLLDAGWEVDQTVEPRHVILDFQTEA